MKKRIISALLAVCLLVSLGTVGVFAADGVECDGGESCQHEAAFGDLHYATLADAVAAANASANGGTITLLKEVSVALPTSYSQGAYVITQDNVKIDGAGMKVTGTGDGENCGHVFIVQADNVTIQNLTIEGSKVARSGIQAYGNVKNLKVTGVTSNNNFGYGLLVNNGATVTASDFNSSGNGWGSVNVDGQSAGATVSLTGGTLQGDLVLESKAGGTNTVTLNSVDVSVVKTNEKNNVGNNKIDINGGNIGTVTLNGQSKDTVEISNAEVGEIKSTNSNAEKPNISLSNSKIGTVPESGVDMVIGSGVIIGDQPAGNNAEAEINGHPYATLAEALAAAENDDVVKLLKDITIDISNVQSKNAAYTISNGITLDGNGKSITATGTKQEGSTHIILVTANGATIQNLTVDVNGKATSGVQAYKANNVELNNVSIKNSAGAAVIVNASSVTATKLTTTGSKWGGVNVDNGPGTTGNAIFSLVSGTVESVYTENGETDQTATVTIRGGTVGEVYNHEEGTGTNTIKIENGYIGSVDDKSVGNAANISVTGGTFGESVDEYAASDLLYEVGVRGEYTYYKNASDAIAAAGSVGNVKYIGDKPSYYTSKVTFVYEKGVYTEITIEDGTTIRLPGGQYKGKTITGWTLGNVTYKDGDRYKVNGNATFYVVLKDGEFDIVIDSKIEHGDISTNVNSADKGDTVYIYVDPDAGYVLDDIDVYYGYNYRNSVKVSYVRNNTYRFEMPNADVYITATFKANGMPFVDVRRTQWFYDSIYYVWSNDMMEGDSATTFNPDGTMTRAMFWAVLGRMDGQTITGTNWVEQARNWAMREGVSDGTNPNDYVTREQMVTMLWRYAGEKNGSANLNRYTDSGSVSGYAVEAMRWAIGNGVIQGVTSTTLAPKANATRAECATIFMRFDKM